MDTKGKGIVEAAELDISFESELQHLEEFFLESNKQKPAEDSFLESAFEGIVEEVKPELSFVPDFRKRLHLEVEEILTDLKKQKPYENIESDYGLMDLDLDTKGKGIVEQVEPELYFVSELEKFCTDLNKQKPYENIESDFGLMDPLIDIDLGWDDHKDDVDDDFELMDPYLDVDLGRDHHTDDVGSKYDSLYTLEHLWEENQWSRSSFDDNILWKCLKFCYLFPRNYEFHKEDLIQLWIAQDFFPFSPNPEGISQIYFDEFIRCHIFRLSGFNPQTRQTRYMLNDCIVGLFEQQIGDEYFREGDANSIIAENTKHSSFPDSIDAFTLKKLYQTRNLCTLLIIHEPGSHFTHIPRDLFLKLSSLRALDLSYTSIIELPSSIGKLNELRYLDLSGTPLTNLPNTLCSLYQLQTLKLKRCLKLVYLPKGTRKLINLRHLEVDLACLLVSMPPGLGDLRYLQSLPAFVVGTEHGYRIAELKHMSNLVGTLRILRLENVTSLEEAKEAALKEKKYLAKLELQWTELKDGLQLLENLRPHKDLEELQIRGYGSANFPSWMGDSVFSNLATITIHDCRICELLPPLGKLSSLYHLCITEMHEVKIIDHTFCGRNTDMGIQPFEYLRHSANSENVNAFSRLEELTLNGMPKLEKWSGVEEGDFGKLQKLSISCCAKLAALPKLVFFKSLQRLDISHCHSLKCFPNEGLPTSLEFLAIVDCPLLKDWCLNDMEQDCGMIADVQHVWIDYQMIPQAQPRSKSGTSLMSVASNPHDIPTEVKVETLTRKIQPQEVELEKILEQQKAISFAGEETAKCKAAKEVNKLRTTQPKDMSKRLPAVVFNINRKIASYPSFRSSPDYAVNRLDLNESYNVVLSSDSVLTATNSTPTHSTTIVGKPEPPTHQEAEWVQQDEPGVYINLTTLPGGVKDLKRVRFSRMRFSEKQAEQWWAENKARVYELYNVRVATSSSDESNNVVLSKDAVPTSQQ